MARFFVQRTKKLPDFDTTYGQMSGNHSRQVVGRAGLAYFGLADCSACVGSPRSLPAADCRLFLASLGARSLRVLLSTDIPEYLYT